MQIFLLFLNCKIMRSMKNGGTSILPHTFVIPRKMLEGLIPRKKYLLLKPDNRNIEKLTIKPPERYY